MKSWSRAAYCDNLCICCVSEELSDLKGQVKMLEDKNTTYMQKNLDLEEVSWGQSVQKVIEFCKFFSSIAYKAYNWLIMKCTVKSHISRTLVGNEIVDHSDVVGASPVGAAPTTSSFST